MSGGSILGFRLRPYGLLTRRGYASPVAYAFREGIDYIHLLPLTLDSNLKFRAHYHASRLSPYFRLAFSIVALLLGANGY